MEQVTLSEVTGIMVGAIVALAIIHVWVNNRLFARPTLDEVMRDPAAFFHDSEWDPVVARLVAEAAYDRVLELHGVNWTAAHLMHQEHLIWQVLNDRLIQENRNA